MESGNFLSGKQLNVAEIGGLSVLLVDDNKVNQFLGKRILQNLGIQNVTLAGSGEDAFDLVSNNVFDVLLTDVEMPGMSGYDLCKKIRFSEGSTKHLKIIALTANASDDDRVLAQEAGIDDYLTKPYSPNDLLEVILRNAGSNGMPGFVMEDMSAKHPTSNSGIAQLYQSFHHNREDVKQFLLMLSHQLPELVEQIKNGILSDDFNSAFQAAHKLKSPVKMLAERKLVNDLVTLTELLKEATNPAQIADKFELIAPGMESLLVRINQELESLDSH